MSRFGLGIQLYLNKAFCFLLFHPPASVSPHLSPLISHAHLIILPAAISRNKNLSLRRINTILHVGGKKGVRMFSFFAYKSGYEYASGSRKVCSCSRTVYVGLSQDKLQCVFTVMSHWCVLNVFLDNNGALWQRGRRCVRLWYRKQFMVVSNV